MTNTNCLAGLKCPHCGNEDRLLIVARIMADVTDHGADFAKGSDWEWDDESFTVCPECDRDGPLAEFRIPEGKAELPATYFGEDHREPPFDPNEREGR